MATYGFAVARGDIRVSGIAKLQLKYTGDDAYYELPAESLREGKVTIEAVTTPDSRKRERGYAFRFMAEVKVMISAVANFLKKLDSIGSGNINFIITDVDTQTYSSGNITVPVIGLKWQYFCDKDMDGDQYVQFNFDRTLTKAEFALLIGTPPADGTPNVADTLYTFLSLTVADINPAGIAKVEIQKVGESAEDLGDIKEGKLTMELLTTQDSRQRAVGYGVQLNVDVKIMQAASTELALWDDVVVNKNNIIITLVNGTVFTFTQQTGVKFVFTSENDMDEIKYIHLTGTGVILSSALDGIIA